MGGARRHRHLRAARRGATGILAVALVIGTVVATHAGSSRPELAPQLGAGPFADALPTPPATTERVSVGADGRQGNGASGGASAIVESMSGDQAISADGRWVAFASTATNLVPGEDHPAGGIFLRDRQAATTSAIPWIGGGAFPPTVTAAEPAISTDGGVVAFTAIVTGDLATGAVFVPSPTPNVLAWDRATNLTELVSVGPTGRPTPGYQPSISADGRYVAYTQWYVDTTPPVLSNLTTDGFPSGGQWFVFGPSAPCTPHAATISVNATDPDDPVASVTLLYQPTGSGVFSQAMANVGGSTWRATINASDAWSTGQITYWVQARDSNGNVSPNLNNASNFLLRKGECIL